MRIIGALLLLALGLTPAAVAQQPGMADTLPASAGVGAAAAVSYSLQPGDVLAVEVWREPDLSGQFRVNEDGHVIIPLLGRFRAADVPIEELRDSLYSAYAAELRNPSIVITPLRRIYVLGEVSVPGLYNVDPTISIAGAVAMAGGANPQGSLQNIRVVRSDGVEQQGLRVDSPLAQSGIASGDQIFVGRRSWFDRNSTFVVSALLSVTSIVISFMR